MSHVLEADESGALTIPAEVLGNASPRSRHVVEPDNRGLHIEPESVMEERILD